MTTGIVFFSRSNNTRVGAEHLAAKLGAELIELVETKGRKGLPGFVKSGYQAATGKKSELQGTPWNAIKNLTSIYLLTPIWGSNITPAMNSFLQEADFKGKKVTAVTFQADQEFGGSAKVADYIKGLVEQSGGKFIKGYALHSALPGKFAGKDYICNQVDQVV